MSLKGGGLDAGPLHGEEGLLAEDRPIEAGILLMFGALHEEEAIGFVFIGALEHIVGSLEGFDGEDGALADDDTLTDIEPGDFAGHPDAEADCLFGGVGATARHDGAGVAEVGVHEGAGIEHGDADCFNFAGDGTEDGMGVAFAEFAEEGEGLEVGGEVAKEFAWGDLTDEEAVAGFEALEGFKEATDLADLDEGALVGGELVDQLLAGFAAEGDEACGDASAAEPLHGKPRIIALAGDHGDGGGGIKIRREETGREGISHGRRC